MSHILVNLGKKLRQENDIQNQKAKQNITKQNIKDIIIII